LENNTYRYGSYDVDIEPFFDNMEIYRSAFKEMFVLGEYTSFGLPQQHLITRS
jgi:hypothetical protein